MQCSAAGQLSVNARRRRAGASACALAAAAALAAALHSPAAQQPVFSPCDKMHGCGFDPARNDGPCVVVPTGNARSASCIGCAHNLPSERPRWVIPPMRLAQTLSTILQRFHSHKDEQRELPSRVQQSKT